MTTDLPISQLTPAQALTGTESIPMVQNGANVRATPAQVAALARLPTVDVNVTTPQPMAANQKYIADTTTGPCTFPLPTTAALGDRVFVRGKNTGGWFITQAANQYIQFGNQVTTTGVNGYLGSQNQGDCVELECIAANVGWIVTSVIGNLTIN